MNYRETDRQKEILLFTQITNDNIYIKYFSVRSVYCSVIHFDVP
jgi:hypothetical protein